MKITFKNLCDDVDATLTIDGAQISVLPLSSYEAELDKKEITFSVFYNRDFRIETGKDIRTDKVFGWITESMGNFIVQIKNTYRVSDLLDGDVIELSEKAHYVPTTKKEAFFKCLPAMYYFAEAECEQAVIEAVSSQPTNRDDFIKFYKRLLKLFNLKGWFKILKYKQQLKRQKRISSDEMLTKIFQSLYELPYEEREYQFKPLLVIADRMIDSFLEKLPKKLRSKAKDKIERVKLVIAEKYGHSA